MKKKIFFTFLSFLVLYISFIYVIVNKSPLNYNEFDIDANKIITLSEVFYGTELGENNLIVNGQNCIEYFSLKDGIHVKMICK